tara:strand:- start:138 stop:971 length:834 start_codon:yes stop_codon:yes gene_type:complete
LTFLERCWYYINLGIIQGLTEFLPISSTAHLKVLPILLGWEDPGVSVIASLQLGSIIAVITYFRTDLFTISRAISKALFHDRRNDTSFKLALSIFVGTLPIVFFGMFIKIFWTGYEVSIVRSIPSIALVSILMSLLMLLAEQLGKRTRTLDDIKILDGLFIGLSQSLALIPGVSRSGITITTALMTGWERQSAAKLTFLLGIPAITLSGIVELKGAIGSFTFGELIPLVLGICSSAIISFISIDFLIKFLQKQNMMIFITYRFFFGILLLAWSHYKY